MGHDQRTVIDNGYLYVDIAIFLSGVERVFLALGKAHGSTAHLYMMNADHEQLLHRGEVIPSALSVITLQLCMKSSQLIADAEKHLPSFWHI